MTSHPTIAQFRSLRAGGVVLIALALLAAFIAWWRQPGPPPAPATPPRQFLQLPTGPWGEGHRGAIVQTGREVDGFTASVGQVRWVDDAVRFEPDRLDWNALNRSPVPLTLALRLQADTPPTCSGDPTATEGWIAASAALQEALETTAGSQGSPPGVQLSLLEVPGDAREWQSPAAAFARQWLAPGQSLSLAVPARWIDDATWLRRLAEGYHRLVVPWPTDSADAEQALGPWLQALDALPAPFLVLLPGPAPLPAPSGETAAEQGLLPSAMARALKQLRQNALPTMEGWVWNGLPADEGAALWNWPTLRAVMMGQTPEATLSASILQVTPYIYEIWLQNTGETTGANGAEARFILYWRGRVPDALVMRDPYYMDHTRTIIRGPVPEPGQRVLVGEFALLDISPGQLIPQVGSAALAR